MLVHGIPGSWRQCVPIASDLGEHRLLFISRPGYGRTPVASGRTYDEQADLIAALLDTTNVERAICFGVSGGGPAAARFAVRHGERTDAVVLACAMASDLVRVPMAMKLAKLPVLPHLYARAAKARGRRKAVDEAFIDAHIAAGLTAYEASRLAEDAGIRANLVMHELGHLEAPPGVAGLRNDLAQIAAARTAPASVEVGTKALLLYGDADTVIGLPHRDRYAAMFPNSKIETFPDTGHLFMLTEQAARASLNAFIRDL